MRQLSASDALMALQSVTTWAACCRVSRSDGDVVRVTSHDLDLPVSISSPDSLGLAGVYLSAPGIDTSQVKGSADLSVDNLEIDALLDEAGITEQDIRAGRFDDVEYVLFLVNWRDPTDSAVVLKTGVVGNISDWLQQLATFEFRGLKQCLQQTIVDTVGPTCRYDLGDDRCGVDLDQYQYAGTVTGISIQRRRIESLIVAESGVPENLGAWFRGGKVRWLTGSNAGQVSEVKEDHEDGDLEFVEPLPFDIGVNDEFVPIPGCDHTHGVIAGEAVGDCGPKFDNIPNFGGEPFVPNQNALMEAADA